MVTVKELEKVLKDNFWHNDPHRNRLKVDAGAVGIIDLLAMDVSSRVVVIELKRITALHGRCFYWHCRGVHPYVVIELKHITALHEDKVMGQLGDIFNGCKSDFRLVSRGASLSSLMDGNLGTSFHHHRHERLLIAVRALRHPVTILYFDPHRRVVTHRVDWDSTVETRGDADVSDTTLDTPLTIISIPSCGEALFCSLCGVRLSSSEATFVRIVEGKYYRLSSQDYPKK